MSAADAAWVLVGLVAGAWGTLIGAGGGFLVVPALLLFYPSLGPAQITSVSLFLVVANAASGTLSYLRQKRVDVGLALRLAAATVPGAVAGAYLVQFTPRRPFELLVGSLLLLLCAALLWHPRGWRSERSLANPAPSGHRRTLVDAQGQTHTYEVAMVPALGISFVVGVASSFLGIGGGLIHVPVLIQLFSLPVHVATATSHLVLTLTALTGVLTHAVRHDYLGLGRLSLELGVGGVIGGQLGAALSRKVGGPVVVRALAAGLALVGARVLVEGLR